MTGSEKTIYVAMAANLVIALSKFAVAWLTGSSAMFAEGIHSVVDTGNTALLLLGLRLSQKPADSEHPFGHGKELYFWTLIVAILIFAVGGGISIYQGVQHLLHPHPLENPTWAYVVLGIAAVAEGSSLRVALKEFRAVNRAKPLWTAIRESKDPAKFTVVFEDSAALLGISTAFFGICLGQAMHNPYPDAAASVVIGLILTAVAVLLIHESRGLLVGEGVDARTLASIRAIAQSDPAVERVRPPLSMYFGPDTVLLNMDIQFGGRLSSGEVEAAIDRIEKAIRGRYPEVKNIFLEAEPISGRSRGDTPES